MEITAFEKLKYSIGALMYTPALDSRIAARLCNRIYPHLSSIAFCFEDTIRASSLKDAEEIFSSSLDYIKNAIRTNAALADNLPLIFIRVRSAEYFGRLYDLIRPNAELIMGFILPKYDFENAGFYEKEILRINKMREKPFYVMPTLESEAIIFKEKRIENLLKLKKYIDAISQYILNIRVGGNDFCRVFGLRRQINQTIYDIAIVKDVLADILNIFSRDYVVSGPVWEYFETHTGDTLWRKGLERELELDRLNGFIGKTAIHPSQLPVITNAMQVSIADYEDALQIVNWQDNILGVSKSASPLGRMNEVNVHIKWAEKILLLSEIYGVSDA
jgi:citrate lyase beta subunit